MSANWSGRASVKAIRAEGCCACGNMVNTEIHHIKTRASGGTNDASNLLPLCSGCHTQEPFAWHRNKKLFLRKFPHVWERMLKMGWKKYHGKLVAPAKAVKGLAIVPATDHMKSLSATIGERCREEE